MTHSSFFRYAARLFRMFKKEKVFTVINIAGLAVGLACALLILLWVQYERSYDGFHAKKDDVYRIINRHQRNGIERNMDGTPGLLGSALKDNFPEIRDFTRLTSYTPVCRMEEAGGPEFKTRLVEVDPQFFGLFDFPFIQGRPETALSDPHSIVISEKTARALFGTADPKYENIACEGVFLDVTDRNAFRPVETGVYLLAALKRLYPRDFRWRSPSRSTGTYYLDLLAGTTRIRESLDAGNRPEVIVASFQSDLERFLSLRKKYLLY